MRYALLLALPFMVACDSITGPDRDLAARDASRIRFVVDKESCLGAVSLDFEIDKRAMGSRSIVAGDSVEFKTSPGMHDVSIRGSDVFGTIGAWQTLQVEAPVRVVLGC